MSRLTRRKFIKTVAAAATVTIAGTKSTGRVLGANEVLRVGVAGINGRGGSHVSEHLGMQNVQITYLIDPDSRTFASKSKTIQARGGNAPRCVADVREALQDRNLDILSIATPNHWHALMTMWAVQADKDVYVEKPSSHNVREGRQTVELARKHNRIVQHGTQSRSDNNWRRVTEIVRSGRLGRLQVAYGLCYKPRNNPQGIVPSVARDTAPRELNFNIWLGPAAERAYHQNLVHYRWHWFWDFGNGDIGNQGVHQMDIARWGIAGGTLPRSVISLGGRYGVNDHGETPNTQISIMDFGQCQLIFETRGLRTDQFHGQGVGNIFKLEEGIIAGNRFYPRGSNRAAPLPEVEVRRGPGNGHFGNFIAAVRSRRREDLNAEILEGHYSSALCHLANISHRLGEDTAFNPRTRVLNGNADATDALQRMEDSLSQTNSLKLSDLRLRVGRMLRLDSKAETCNGDADANRMLTRENRRPFVVS